MGRVPGIRARNHVENSTSISRMTTASETAPPSEAGLQQQSDFSNEMLQGTSEQSVIDWSADFDFPSNNELLELPGSDDVHANLSHEDNMIVDANRDSLNAELGTRVASPGQSSGRFFSFAMDNSSKLRGPAQSQRVDSYEPLPTPTSSSSLLSTSSSGSRNQNDSQCVLACIQIISSLENYIATELRSEDLILNVSHCAAAQLSTLVDMQKDSRTVRCLVLFSTVLHQLFELLEVGCSTILAERDGQGSSISSVLSGELKSFGNFGLGPSAVDVEEQLTWKARKMAKVLQHTMEVLHKVSALARAGPVSQTRRQPVDRDWCLNDLMRRISHLHSQLCNKAS